MAEKEAVTKKGFTADWFMRGALAKIGDAVDKFTGRNWQPSSTLATSELVERLKKLLDSEARDVPGKGMVVPHRITLKMQWDKFSADEGDTMRRLENELLTAAADHVNDNLYFTYAPLHLEVKPDYFTEGVKLLVSFDKLADDADGEAELNVTMPAIKVPVEIAEASADTPSRGRVAARFTHNGRDFERTIDLPHDGRFTVGRTGSNGLVLDDISVSKVHASIVVSDVGLAVADTGSTNGTFVNDKRISYGRSVPFEENDKVKFGTVEVSFHIILPEVEDEARDPEGTVQIGEFEFASRTQDLPAADPEPGAATETHDGEGEKPE